MTIVSVGSHLTWTTNGSYEAFNVKNTGSVTADLYVWANCGGLCEDWEGIEYSSVAPGQTVLVPMWVDPSQTGSGVMTVKVQGIHNGVGLSPLDSALVLVDASSGNASQFTAAAPSNVTTAPNGSAVWLSPGTQSVSFQITNHNATATFPARVTLSLLCGGFTNTVNDPNLGSVTKSCGSYSFDGQPWINEQTPANVSIQPGSWAWVTPAFQGVNGQTGTIKLIKSVSDPTSGAAVVDTASIFVIFGDPTAPNITVSPPNGTTVTSSPITQLRVDWCDPDDALVQHDLTWQGQGLPNVYTPTTKQGCHDAGTSIYNALAINPWAQTLVATARDAAGHTVTSTNTITYAVPLSLFKPSVTASAGWDLLPGPSPVQGIEVFSVKNTGSYTASYNLSPICSDNSTLSSCYLFRTQVTLAPGATDIDTVHFTRSGALDRLDTLKLVATYTSPLSTTTADTGRRVVVAESSYRPDVIASGTTSVPPNHSANAAANGRRTWLFYASDAGNASATYTLNVTCTGAMAGCTFPNGSATTTSTAQPGSPAQILVGLDVGPVGSTGRVQVVMTAPPQVLTGIVQADTDFVDLTAADLLPPTITIAPFPGSTVTINGEQVRSTSLDSTTLAVDVCDPDGTVGTPTLRLDNNAVTATSVSLTTRAGCFTAKHALFWVGFGDGIGQIGASVSDGHQMSSTSLMYNHDAAWESTPQIVAVNPTLAVPAFATGTDTFVVTNPGFTSVNYSTQLSCTAFSCSMSPSYNTLSLSPRASIRIPVTYNVGAVGSSQLVQLFAEYDGVYDTTTSPWRGFTVNAVGTIAPTIAVTPSSGTVVTSSPINQVRIDWCDPDDAIAQHSVIWQGQTLPDTYVATTRSGCAAAGTSLYNNLAISLWQQTLVASATDVAGHTVTSTTTVTYSPPLSRFAPSVTSSAEWHRLPGPAAVIAADTFTVTNAGTDSAVYALRALCGGTTTLSDCQLDKGSASLAPGASTTAIVSYQRSGASDVADTLKLSATYTSPLGGVVADTGRKIVISPSIEPAPIVTAPIPSYEMPPSVVAASTWFWLKNPGTAAITYHLSESFTGGYQPRYAPIDTMTVGPGEIGFIFYNVVTPDVSGAVGTLGITVSYVTITGQTMSASSSVQLTTTASSSQSGSFTVTGTGSPLLPTNSTSNVSFTVRNTGNASVTASYTRSCTTGGAIASCGSPDHSSATIAAGASDVVSLPVTAGPTSGVSGIVTLTATAGSINASGSLTLSTAVGGGPLIIAAANLTNVGLSITRDACLTIAAGDGAAYECGDLRLVHALPATTTMNRARAPALIYSSAQAHPVSLVAADITIDASICPSQVIVFVRFPARNDSILRTVAWNGVCGQTDTRRVVVPVDAQAHSLTTGVYPYILEVRTSVGPTSYVTADSSGLLAVVNRATAGASPFGIGWWLDGLESLIPVVGHSDQMFWVGGDGSTRLYTQLPGTPFFTVRPAIDRPDTLEGIANGNGGYAGYERHLRSGATVQFDAYMRHVATINSLGHTTHFYYDGTSPAQLDSLSLPVPDQSDFNTRRLYRFEYVSGLLASVSAPADQHGARTVALTRSGSDLLITDPGSPPVRYTSDAQNRVTVRINRLGDGTRFDFDPSAGVLTHVGIDLTRTSGFADSVRTAFCPAEAVSVADCANVPVDPLKVRTLYDGPRSDVVDTTSFRLTRFGAPETIVNAVGQTTTIERTDLKWPLLPTAVVDPIGHRVTTTYDSLRALPLARTDVNLLSANAGDGSRPSTTTYEWADRACDEVTAITGPSGEVTRLDYNHPSCTRHTQRDGRGDSTTVTFSYDALNRLTDIAYPNTQHGGTEHFGYDSALGNLATARTPLGIVTSYDRDGIGRDTLVTQPLDSSGAARQTRTVRDIVGRDSITITKGPAAGLDAVTLMEKYFPPLLDSIVVRTWYDAENRPDSLAREMATNTPTGIGRLVTRWTYDAAGRKRTETAPDHQFESYTYGDGANVTSLVTRKADVVIFRYDRLNRVVAKQLPSTSSVDSLGTLTVPAQIDSFTYDAAGRMTSAVNAFAQVQRTYTIGGLLSSELQRIATQDGLFGQHDYQLRYDYDLSGRRIRLDYPTQLQAGTGVGDDAGSLGYGYNQATGSLDTLFMLNSRTVLYARDARGRIFSTLLPNGVRDIRQYDDDDRVSRIVQRAPLAGLGWFPGLLKDQQDTIHADMIDRDLTGRAIHVTTYDDFSNHLAYHGLGQLLEFRRDNTNRSTDEQYTTDALGNLVTSELNGNSTGAHHNYDATTGRLTSITQQDITSASMQMTYDPAGNQRLIARERLAPALSGNLMQLFTREQFAYDAAGHLRFEQKRANANLNNPSQVPTDEDSFDDEETRYDALGRRVWVRSAHVDDALFSCGVFCSITRFVWDGDQLLGEFRLPAAPTTNAESDLTPVSVWQPVPDSEGLLHRGSGDSVQTYSWRWGRVIYTHGAGGPDQPVAVTRAEGGDSTTLFDPFTMYPLTDYRGNVAAVAFRSGGPLNFGSVQATPPLPTEANADLTAYRLRGNSTWAVSSWAGSLINGQFGESGLEYRRNRYYDPQQGRFTQEDPIGLAGGMNLYGFGGGDPINFADPFGLRPCPPDNDCGPGGGGAVLGAGCPAISDGCNSAPLVPKSGKEALAKGAMLVGAAAVGFGGAALLEAVAGTAAEAAELEVSSGPMQAMERQLARDGPKSVQSTIKALTKNIAEHESKIAEAAQRGGNTSSMEREIRAWQETLKAAQKVLEKNP